MAPTPHDALVHAILSQPEHAAAELAAVLPPSMLQHLDLSSLAILPGTFIDEELRDRHADLLYTVRQQRGASTLIYILFEHQSSFDAWMPLRLLAYQLRIWESWRREHPDATKLPPIVPVVLHHGTKPWPGSREFADLLDLDAAARGDFAEQ